MSCILLEMSRRDHLIQVFIVSSVVLYFLYLIFISFLARLFKVQFNPHIYRKVKELDSKAEIILKDNFTFYKNLSSTKRKYFNHRVGVFISNYTFHGKEGLEITSEMKVLIAGNFTLLTFGMADFKPKVFDKIILYPHSYLSTNSGLLYKGEFNPKMRSIVFSWSDFMSGLQITNDNLNLGLHEFTHVLQYQSKLSQSPSYIIFDDMVDEINTFLEKNDNKMKIINSNFLRNYAFTNDYEFLAVLVEHFFESPKDFKFQFPKLYSYVKKMINYKELH